MSKRIKSKKYPGVYYRETKRLGIPGIEKVFYIVFKQNGVVHEEKCGRQYADRMTEAKAANIRLERILGRVQSRKEIREEKKKTVWTFDRLWQEYRTFRPDLKGYDIDHGRYNKHIKGVFGNRQPQELDPLSIERLKANMRNQGKSPKTIKAGLELLRRLANFGTKKGLCLGLSFRIDMPKVNNLKTEDLTDKQLADLLNAIENDKHPYAGPIMKLALFTGMRKGEMLKLQWKDIDHHRGFINIRDPKSGQDQTIPLNDSTRVLLKSLPKTSEFVFPGPNGKQRVGIKKQVNRIKKAAGLPKDFRPLHGLRHTYASMLASSGQVDLYQLQRLLTHKDSKTTQRYAHLRDEALRKAASVAGEIIENIPIKEHPFKQLDNIKE